MGLDADLTLPNDKHGRIPFEPMTYWQFVWEQPVVNALFTCILAGACTFLIGLGGSLHRRQEQRPVFRFALALATVSIMSILVGAMLAAWHVPIGEQH